MSESPERTSAEAKQLLSDMAVIAEAKTPLWGRGYVDRQTLRDIENSKEQTRILANYVAYLLDRVEHLEHRLDEKQ